MQFESLVRYKALSQRYNNANQLLDHDQNNDGENAEKLGLKKVQFMVSPSLHEDLKSVCAYLEMSQREFLESLLSDALSKTWEIVREENADPESLGHVKES